MIRINLLPKVEIKKPRKGIGEMFIGTLALLVVLGVILATHFTQAGKIRDTKNQIKITEKKITALKDVEKQVNEFKEKNMELERRIQIIADLEKKRSGPLYVMDSLSTSIPARSWIENIKTQRNSTSITGIAWNEFTVAEFMKNLQNSNYFKDVQLKVIKQEEVSSLQLRKFEIISKMDFIGTKDTPDKDNEGEDASKGKKGNKI